jgi:hypothetical protein
MLELIVNCGLVLTWSICIVLGLSVLWLCLDKIWQVWKEIR